MTFGNIKFGLPIASKFDLDVGGIRTIPAWIILRMTSSHGCSIKFLAKKIIDNDMLVRYFEIFDDGNCIAF